MSLIAWLKKLARLPYSDSNCDRQKSAATELRGLAKNENVLIITATQTNRGGMDRAVHSESVAVHDESVAQSSPSFCDCSSPNMCCNTNVPEEGKLVDQRDQLEIMKKQLEVLRAATHEKLYPKHQVVNTDEDGEYENCYSLE